MKMKKTSDSLQWIAFLLSCVVLSWIITFRDICSFLKCIFHTVFRFSSNPLQCFGRGNVNIVTLNSNELTSEGTCTKNDGSFVVSKEEIEVVMGILGLGLDKSNNEGEVRGNNIGSMEIIALFEENEASRDEVREAFHVFDENGDGYVDAKELKRVIGDLGLKEASEEECQMMINIFDFDGDGVINVDEFEKLLENSFSS